MNTESALFRSICKRCKATFEKPTQTQADSALRMHIGRKHSKHIMNKDHTSALLRRGRNGLLVAADKPSRRTKRKYTPRRHKTESRPKEALEIKVNFCPVCSCNIGAVAIGMALAQQKL